MPRAVLPMNEVALPGFVELATRSPEPGGSAPEAVVCVPTLRRPAQLEATLRSLAAQRIPGGLRCVVADNDAEGRDGVRTAMRLFEAGLLAGAAVVVRRPGNCSACNGAFAAARVLYPDIPLVAMIDDDEVAEPDWLETLVDAQRRSGADLVAGPVFPVFERTDAARFAAHPVFKPFYTESGPVAFLYGSGNVLLRAAVLDSMGQPTFDEAFDFVGGGDIDFFKRCAAAGFTAWFEARARVSETVPAARTSLRWVLARSMRHGAVNVMIETRAARTGLRRAAVPAKTVALLGLSLVRAARQFARSGNALAAAHPVLEAVGRAAAQVGLRPEQYRQPGPQPR